MSANTKNTPGPWMYQGQEPWKTEGGEFVQWGQFTVSAVSLDINDDGYYRIGAVSNANNEGQNEANARLIAAAPELLDVVLAWLPLMESLAESGLGPHAMEMARAAIVKATGKDAA